MALGVEVILDWASGGWSQGRALVGIVAGPIGRGKLLGKFWVGFQGLGGFEELAKAILVIISTNSCAHASKLENCRWHARRSFLYSYSTVVMYIANLASCFLQSDGNLMLARLWSGHLYLATLFKASSYANACLAIFFGFCGFVAHKQLRLAEIWSSEYSNVLSYIIASLAVISCNSKSGTWPASVWLYIQLSQQSAKSRKDLNVFLHIKHVNINYRLHL